MGGLRYLAASALLAFSLALATAGSAGAARATGASGASAENPIVLIDGKTAGGTLMGSSGGSFDYYSFNYPGNDSESTITLSLNTNDPAVSNAVGINVWQNGSKVANMNAVGEPVGVNSFTFFSTKDSPILVQLYNYADGKPATYQLTISGPKTSPASSAPTSRELGSTTNPIPLTGSQTGTLAASAGGSYTYYTLPYPGDGSTQTVNLSFSPNDPATANSLFVVVYQDGAEITTAQGNQGEPPGRLSVDYSSTTSGPVVIQVASYSPDTTVSYTISR